MGKIVKNNDPVISVVMSVYNGGEYLPDSIRSILNQTYKNFEFIIINDGSTDKSLEVIEKYKSQDKRIVLITRENKGLVASLNEGIEKARGRYIARMDADDISMPERFEKQIDFIEKENIDICGSDTQGFNEYEELSIRRYPESDQDIKFTLMFRSPFSHPSVLIKRIVFKTLRYREDFKCAEDYRLWADLALNDYKMGNISRVLLKYRVHKSQTTVKQSFNVQHSADKTSYYYLNNINDNAKVISDYVVRLQAVASSTLLKEVLIKLKKYKTNFSVSDAAYIIAARIILRKSQYINFKLFLV